MPDFSDAEKRMLSYFKKGVEITFNGKTLKVEEADKPTCNKGEPKTDIFVLVGNDSNKEEIKISYKKENADFLENKTNSTRAEQLFGYQWKDVVRESTGMIEDEFRKRILIYKEKLQHTEKGSITLGWKFELLNKPGGDLSGRINLSPKQVYDVYAGTNLSSDKKNSFVNGRIIPNSGVADYILITDNVSSAQEIIDKMIPIEEYVKMHPDIYFACKALNYRTFSGKYDGDRPLAVQVDWKVNSNKLQAELCFDQPLERNGKAVAEQLLRCLSYLRISTTDDIDENNTDIKNINE